MPNTNMSNALTFTRKKAESVFGLEKLTCRHSKDGITARAGNLLVVLKYVFHRGQMLYSLFMEDDTDRFDGNYLTFNEAVRTIAIFTRGLP